MNLSKEKMYDILKVDFPDKEWLYEIKLQLPERSWTYTDVKKFLATFSEFEEYDYLPAQDILQVSLQNTLLEIEGLENISQYCNNEDFSVPHRWFEHFEVSRRTVRKEYNYDFVATLVSKKKTLVDESSVEWNNVPKSYLQMKRSGYVHKESGMKYLVDVLNTGTEVANSMRAAPMTQTIELKLVLEKAMPVEEIMSHLMFVYSELSDDPFPMTVDAQKAVLGRYHRLIAQVRDISRYEQANPTSYFLAPKPITLEQKNLVEPEQAIGITTILKNYAVTDKADGERMLLYVDEDSKCYLINSVFQVKDTGIVATSAALASSLLDGEYIVAEKVFIVFDVYFVGRDNLMKLPLMAEGEPNRYAKMEIITQTDYWNTRNSPVRIELKKHIRADGAEMFKVCKDILNAPRKYNIDGLVFTPVDLPVFAYYPGQFKKIRGKGMAWDKVFKWKPPEQNTIDFLVREEPGIVNNSKRFKLFTGYNAAQWEEISVWRGLQKVYQRTPVETGEEEYKAKLFKPIENYTPKVSMAVVPLSATGQALTAEKEPIEDNTIVEMSYDMQKGWQPLRIREDKTKLLRTSKTITKTANDLSVALNIWHSIHHPVTVEHIIGQEKVPSSAVPIDIEERLLGTNDVYYARDIPRNHMLSVHMLNFHNHGVKSMLYSLPAQKDMLLELACGMAGDLPRWRDNHYNFILGVDLVKNNIESANGSYARYLSQRQEYMKRMQRGHQRIYYPGAVFLVGDCALPLETGEAAKDKDPDSEMMLKLLYQGKTYEKYSFLNNYRLPGKASKKFDAVSCQFAIHYFFKTKELLEGFLRNVSFNLKPNALFFATFMDGKRVHALINKNGFAEGKKGSASTIVWAIQKQYKSYTKASAYGKLIDVFLENTNQFIPEFLVHFDVLVEKAKEFQLELVDEGFFEATFKELHEKVQKKDPTRNIQLDVDIQALANDPVQTQFSFLNRWVVFRKVSVPS